MSATHYSTPRLDRGFSVRDSVGSITTEGWILGALIVVAAVIRIITLNNQSIWADEALTAYEAGLPFGAMIHTVTTVETTPPLYFVLVWGWAKVFGAGTEALRSLSAIAGVAMVPIAYLSARDLISRRAGLLAAAFVTVNPFMIWYSQEARAYMLVAALAGASFLWFVRALRDPSRGNLAWWAVLSSLALMTHFFAGFAVAPEAIWLLYRSRTRLTAAAVGVVALAQIAMLPFAIEDSSAAHGVSWISHSPPQNRIAVTVIEWGASNFYRRINAPEGLLLGLVLVVVVGLLLAFGSDQRTRRGAGVAGLVAVTVFVLPLLLGVVGIDYFLSRNLIPAFIPVVVMLAAACLAPRARVAGRAAGRGSAGRIRLYLRPGPDPELPAAARLARPGPGDRSRSGAQGGAGRRRVHGRRAEDLPAGRALDPTPPQAGAGVRGRDRRGDQEAAACHRPGVERLRGDRPRAPPAAPQRLGSAADGGSAGHPSAGPVPVQELDRGQVRAAPSPAHQQRRTGCHRPSLLPAHAQPGADLLRASAPLSGLYRTPAGGPTGC